MKELAIAAQIVSKVLEIGLINPTAKQLAQLFAMVYKDLINPHFYVP